MRLLDQARAELRRARVALAAAEAAIVTLRISPMLPGLEEAVQVARPHVPFGPAWPTSSGATA